MHRALRGLPGRPRVLVEARQVRQDITPSRGADPARRQERAYVLTSGDLPASDMVEPQAQLAGPLVDRRGAQPHLAHTRPVGRHDVHSPITTVRKCTTLA